MPQWSPSNEYSQQTFFVEKSEKYQYLLAEKSSYSEATIILHTPKKQ